MPTKLPFRSVLVTGADGFVGRALSRRIAAALPTEGRLTLCAREAIEDASVIVAALDLADDASVASIVAQAQPDLIVHLAAQSSVAGSTASAAATWQVNLVGTMRLATAMAALPAPATLLFASSAEVYGRSFNDGCLNEDAVLRPQSPYARSKAAAEAALADILPRDSQLIVARPCNHSGPGQDARFVLPAFAEQIAEIEHGLRAPVMRVGNLTPERDFLHVDDVLDAYLALIGAAATLPARATFNIASGEPVAIGEMLDRLLALSAAAVTVEVDPARVRAVDIARACLAPDRIRVATGWRPTRSRGHLLRALLDDQRHTVAARVLV